MSLRNSAPPLSGRWNTTTNSRQASADGRRRAQLERPLIQEAERLERIRTAGTSDDREREQESVIEAFLQRSPEERDVRRAFQRNRHGL